MQALFFMDANSNSFEVASPTTNYGATVIGGNLSNTGNIGNGDINMTSENNAKAGDLDFSMSMPGMGGEEDGGGIPSIPEIGLLNLLRARQTARKSRRLAVLLI